MTDLDPSSSAFFERLYRGSDDPWSFASRPYEQRRFSRIIDALGPRSYRCAFEPGCSQGELTLRLAERCGFVEAHEFSQCAAERARRRCRDHANVHIRCADWRRAGPLGPTDLMVLSEIGYYLDADALAARLRQLTMSLTHDAVIVACHWLGSSPDHEIGGHEVHAVLGGMPGWRCISSAEPEGAYRLERFERGPQ